MFKTTLIIFVLSTGADPQCCFDSTMNTDYVRRRLISAAAIGCACKTAKDIYVCIASSRVAHSCESDVKTV